MLKPAKKDHLVVDLTYLLLIYIVLSLASGFILRVILKIQDFYIPKEIIVSLGILFFLSVKEKVEFLDQNNSKYGLYTILITFILTISLNFQPQIPGFKTLGTLLFRPLGTGIFEETIFRVLMIWLISRFSKNIYLQVYLSTILFGIAHILNMFSLQQSTIQTAIQIGYALGLGSIFAISYLITRNIIFSMISHSLADFMAGLNGLSLRTNINFDTISVILMIFFVITSIYCNYWFLKKGHKLIVNI
ncbi:CPBP family intramembrane glutamic endopeptidase [Companilactobacillus keshanensis]|uniref:CPBP family intramembrane glutamic endopeptidase n=1 Tax=Companilactobacillus keshanensis TaxID=2486003 RepID=A0ABW4BVK9_9LACO|nr:CPBP family intramembrane glutamic endopeptidase [Companilactobacillus keshanensis]